MSEKFFENILNNLPCYIFIIDNDGFIIYINQNLKGSLKFDKDLVGKLFYDIINFDEFNREEIPELLKAGIEDKILRSTIKNNCKDLLIEWNIKKYKNNDKYEFQFNGYDISDKVEKENKNRELINNLAMLNAFNAVAPNLTEIKLVFKELFELFSTFFPNIDRTSVLLYDEETNSLLNEEEAGLNCPKKNITFGHQPIGTSISGKCFLENRIIYIPDCSETDIIPQKYIEELQLKSTVAIPIRHKNKPIGVLRLDNTKVTNAFTESDINFYSLFADQFGLFLQNLRMMEEISSARKKIEESEAKYRALVNNLPEVFLVYSEGKILYINDKVEDFLGYKSEELIGCDLINFVFPEYREIVYTNMLRRKKGEIVPDYEIEIMTKNGDRKWVIVRGQKLFFQEKESVLIILIDITERKFYEKKLSEYSQRLKEINASKDKFFTIIAHDLKSPLFGSLGIAEFFASNASNFTKEELTKVAETLYLSLKNQYELLEDLLFWSRIEMGILTPKIDSHIPYKSIEKIVNLLQSRIKEKNLNIIINVDKEKVLNYDIHMFELLIRNLISNAIKFSYDNGNIRIELNENETEFIFSISDNGVGIDPAGLEKLFKLDVYYSTPGTKNEKGTGLGLILCKEIINKHKGRIWVESQKNVGSTFYFSIPKTI